MSIKHGWLLSGFVLVLLITVTITSALFLSDSVYEKPGHQHDDKLGHGSHGHSHNKSGANISSTMKVLQKFARKTNTSSLYARQYGAENQSWKHVQTQRIHEANWSESFPNDPTSAMWELTTSPDRQPTSRDVERAWTLYNETWHTIQDNNWTDMKEARRDGYRRSDFPSDTLHYPNKEHLYDDSVSSTDKPAFLMHNVLVNNSLVGVQMFPDHIHTALPELENPLIHPHTHVWETPFCYHQHVYRRTKTCPEDVEGQQYNYTPQMFHIWYVENKEGGPFATSMNLVKGDFESAPSKLSKEEFKRELREHTRYE